jgi:LuxR family maltose regulon positive regulatory protein
MSSPAPLAPPVPHDPDAMALRPGVVPRPRLVRRLLRTGAAPVVALVAPAGYGKSTALAEWAARDERPFHRLAPEEVACAVPAIVAEARYGSRVFVLDDAHRVAPRALAALLEAASGLPSGTVLAVASRGRLEGPAGRLRAHRLLDEVPVRELVMGRLEAALLLDAAGVRVDARQVDRLVERTEGWPVALYLAALSLSEQDDTQAAVAAFSGADRTVAEYIECELLAGLDGAQRAFLRRASVLGELSGPLCDAVLQTTGSAALLLALRRHGLPIEAVDRDDTWFRLHPLLGQALRTELARRDGDGGAALHGRAADWYERHGDLDDAARHAVACRDVARAGRLLWAIARRDATAGREGMLGPWLKTFGDRAIAAHPQLALAAATHDLCAGRTVRARRAVEQVRGAAHAAPAALLRACIGTGGAAQRAADARAGRDACPSLAALLLGVTDHLRGDRATARAHLEDAAGRAAGHIPVVAAVAHAQLALLDADAADWEGAERSAHEADTALEGVDAPDAARALVLTVAAAVEAHRGDVAQARHDALDARRLLERMNGFPQWLVVETAAWLARVEIRLSDGPAARALLARAARLHAQVDDAPVLARWVHEGWARADAFAESATGDGPTLTPAELRILRLLPSHLSFREIGARLHVSTNTVKTQALSVYRKLDVSSRSEAVARGHAAGLIGS